MSFSRYPTYKTSGLDWLGDVPDHWEQRRLGFYFTERRERVSDREFPPLSVTKAGIVPQLETAAKTDDGDNRKRVCVGDFVINSRSDRQGSAGVSPFEGSVSLISTVLEPQTDVYPRFVHHLLRSQLFQQEYYRFGKGIVADLWSTSYSEMRNITLAMPPVLEQVAIACFVDRETESIDALLAEQQRLIELLKEKRQAIISHAFTKGLNPDAPMKATGIEWLGEVPEHWTVGPLRHVIDRIESGTSVNAVDEPRVGEMPAVLKTSSVYTGAFDPDENKSVVAEEISRLSCPLRADTLIVSRMNTPDLIGFAGVVSVAPKGIFLPDRLWQVSFVDAEPRFVHFWTRTSSYRDQVRAVCTGTSASMKNLGQDQFMALLFANPPKDEQEQIVAYLDARSAAIDELIHKAERAIVLLQERRTALSSAAVTGKIDVRRLADAEAA